MDVFDIHDCFIGLAITAQLTCTIVALKMWYKMQTKTTLWLMLYITIEFCRSSIGIIMATSGIYTNEFYHYSALLTQTAIFFFAITIIKKKKHQRLTIWGFVIALLAFTSIELIESSNYVKMLFEFPVIFEIFAGVVVLNDRVHNHEGKQFKNDPWSVMVMVIVMTQLISMVSLNVGFFCGFFRIEFEQTFVFIVNCISVTVRFTVISLQLWKFKTY
jgi:hypothetical protein